MTGKRQAKKDGVDDSDEETAAPVQIKPKRPHKRKYRIQSYIEVTRDLEGTYWMDLKILWDASCVVFFNVIDFVVGFLMQK